MALLHQSPSMSGHLTTHCQILQQQVSDKAKRHACLVALLAWLLVNSPAHWPCTPLRSSAWQFMLPSPPFSSVHNYKEQEWIFLMSIPAPVLFQPAATPAPHLISTSVNYPQAWHKTSDHASAHSGGNDPGRVHRLWDGHGGDKDDRDLPAGVLRRDQRARTDIDYGDTAISHARPVNLIAPQHSAHSIPNGSDRHLPAGEVTTAPLVGYADRVHTLDHHSSASRHACKVCTQISAREPVRMTDSAHEVCQTRVVIPG